MSLLLERYISFVPNDLLVADLKRTMELASDILGDMIVVVDASPTSSHTPLMHRLLYHYEKAFDRIDWLDDVKFRLDMIEEFELTHPFRLSLQYFSALLLNKADLSFMLEVHMDTIITFIIQRDVVYLKRHFT